MKHCTRCGGEASAEALFCPTCGVRLSGTAVPQSTQDITGAPSAYEREAYGEGNARYGQTPYVEPPSRWDNQGGYYPPPAKRDNPPSKGSMLISILGLVMSIFLNPVLTYPIIAYGIHLSNKELKTGLTSKTTARNICTAALFIAIGSHVISLALQVMGYNIYQSL